jgi:hypothetical protein
MPWASEDLHDGGVVVDGIYEELTSRMRTKCRENRIDPRWAFEHPGEEDPGPPGPHYRYPGFRLLDALEAGKDVILSRTTAEVAHDFRFRLPWDRSVRSVRVSPDDVVRPTEEEHPWYGRAAGEANFHHRQPRS